MVMEMMAERMVMGYESIERIDSDIDEAKGKGREGRGRNERSD